ncbi:hypothetical protein IJS77_05245 [bacterium]|nr:hypothetical protein [bacterium]
MVDFFIFIKEQQKIELILDSDRRIYGVVISVIGDRVTVSTDQKVILKENQPLEVNTYSDNGVYSGQSRVLSYNWEYKKRTIVIEYPKEIKHSQRREYLRANIITDFELNVTDGEFEDKKESVITGKTRDICGKGMSFYYSKPLSQFSNYSVKIKLKGKEIYSSCRMVYTKMAVFEGKPQFINAFVLTGITIDDSKFITDECIAFHLKKK